ncbi:hypothetical protein MA16_Dca022370 [Dendrobium catenatum]|uniref:Uncharacterized protein n=1 Tax=Dendrobium catenatum TaxID=906689 RepID=A0A2I0VT84_9ASPA|nr:hypothetical protein MA16_Dca022370 [Dendrobium catenatum]
MLTVQKSKAKHISKTKHTKLCSFLSRLVDQGLVNMGNDSTTCNGSLDESIKLLITANSQLQVARSDSLNLQVLTGIPSQLQNLSSKVFKDGCRVHCCCCTDTTIGCNS